MDNYNLETVAKLRAIAARAEHLSDDVLAGALSEHDDDIDILSPELVADAFHELSTRLSQVIDNAFPGPAS